MLRDFSLRDFGASLNTVESYTNESSQGKIGLCETVNKQKCTHLGMFLASDYVAIEYTSVLSSKTAYISFRNGSPRFAGYYKVLTQTEYDTLEANGQIVDAVMYVIVGD